MIIKNMLTLTARGSTLDVRLLDVYRRHILMTKVDRSAVTRGPSLDVRI